MARIISLLNHKGGVGKTSSTAFLGEALSRMGKKVLLVDLDAQANLTRLFTDQEIKKSIYDSITRKEPLPILKVKEGLSLVPSELTLARAEAELSGRMAREAILKKLIHPVEGEYDFILLDCPPALNIITSNALVACTDVYIPLTAEALPLRGLKTLEDVVAEAKESLNDKLDITGIIITRYNNRKLNKAVLETVQSTYGKKVFDTMIRENISIAETPLYGGDLYEYAPESNGAKDYEALAKEVLQRTEGA